MTDSMNLTTGEPIHAQFVQVERRGTRHNNGSPDGSTTDSWGWLLFQWWMWMHRSPSEFDEPNPIGWKSVK